MFVAQIHNKLTRSEEDMEDLLTSNVFGIWRYLSAQLGLAEFLSTAEGLDGSRLAIPPEAVCTRLRFWPWIHEANAKGAVPDVLIEMTVEDQERWLVLVEAKYLSGKSSPADDGELPNDQLAREMKNLRVAARRGSFDRYALVYVTAHTAMPRDDLEDAIHELQDKTGDGSTLDFYWTTWRRLPQILSKAQGFCEGPYRTMLDDLQLIIERLGLVFFENVIYRGWTLGGDSWVFRHPIVAFDWQSTGTYRYTFEGPYVRFQWRAANFWPSQTQWRFN